MGRNQYVRTYEWWDDNDKVVEVKKEECSRYSVLKFVLVSASSRSYSLCVFLFIPRKRGGKNDRVETEL